MSFYESIFIARQDISAAQVDALVDTFSAIIESGGGSVAKKEYWGLKNMAYRIKKNRKGHYVMLGLDAPPEALRELERNLRINEDVLRFMTVRMDELEEGPSVQMQARSSRRGDRDRDRDRGDRGRDRDRERGPRGEADEAESGDGAVVSAPAVEREPAEVE